MLPGDFRRQRSKAHFLLSKFNSFLKELEGRRKTASFIRRHSTGIAQLQAERTRGVSSWCNLSFRLTSEDKITEVIGDLRQIGVDARRYYHTLACDMKGFDHYNQDVHRLKVSREASKSIVSLPCHGLGTSTKGTKLLEALSKIGFIGT